VRSVGLIGMPGAGKSTVGILLAKRLGLGFIDTDVSIQVREGRSLARIVREDGYLALRWIEEQVLLALDPRGQVVATGGSAVYGERAMAHLRAHGPMVYLDVPVATLRARVPDLRVRGIAGPPGYTLEQIAAERAPLYLRHADVVIDAGGAELDTVVERVAAAL